jgi:phosphate transport system permease protein
MTQPAAPSLRLRQSTLSRGVVLAVMAATIAVSLALFALTELAGTADFVVFATVATTIVVTAVSWAVEGRRRAVDRLATNGALLALALTLLPLGLTLAYTIKRGLERFNGDFLTHSMAGVGPTVPGGGVYHAIIGTLEQVLLASLISVPLGLLVAIYVTEYGHNALGTAIRFLIDVMTGIPSIVAGLFAVALFTLLLGPGTRLGFAGALALSVLMIPVVVRSTEEMLKIVPNELREASYALGVPKWRTILKVVIPTSIAGIASGITIAIARVIGETAPLLVTVGITTGMNLNPFDGRMATLPVFAYYSYTQPGVPPEPSVDRAWAAALMLIILVMLLNLVARLIARLFAPKTR